MVNYTSESYFVNPAHGSIAKSRYYLKDQEGNVVERDIFEVFDRVNSYVFQNDPEHKAEMQRLCEEKKFMYAGRPLAQAGTGIKNMFNCFVLGIGDSREEISECQRIHFHVQAHGGGTGINFSKLRPSGSWCKGANARSSGPEGFITAMGYLSSNIQQGGNRCLPGDARVSMADGSWKNIDQVRPGDEVLVFDKSSRSVVSAPVLNFFENGIQDVYEYTLTGGKKIRSTDTHRWLGQQTDGTLLVRTIKDMPQSSTKIGFVDAGGVQTRPANGVNFYSVKEVRNLGPDLTYCIEVDHPDHLFIVDGAVSHNSGANMGILEDWHPGLLKFITKKSRGNWENIRRFAVVTDENQFSQWQWMNPYQWQTFNVSVALSDDFMRQVKRQTKKPWKLYWDDVEWFLWDFQVDLFEHLPDGESITTTLPITVCAPDEEVAIHEAQNEIPFRNTSTLKMVNGPYHLTASEWFEKICTNAWEDGCPGIFFIDRAREYHNGEYFNKLEATNPCHRGNSLVHTDRGLVRIQELTGEVFSVITPTGEHARAICFPTGTGRIYRVRFKQGGYLDLTSNHNLINYESRRKVQVQNLMSGTRLLAPTLPISPLNSEFIGDESDGFLLGWVLGDGCIFSRKSGKDAGRTCLFTMVGKDDGDDISDFVIKRLNLLKTNRHRDLNWSTSKGNKEIVSSDEGIVSWFVNKYQFPFSKEEGIPVSILRGSRDLQRGFLQGLFAADGHVSKVGRRISLTSSREEILFHTKCLLQTFGIDSTYRMRNVVKDNKEFERGDLTITGKEAIKFFDRVGFGLHSRKNELCRRWSGRCVNTNKDFVVVKDVIDLGVEEPVYNITVDHPSHQYMVSGVVSANCAEQILPEWSVCCLSSVVLPEFVTEEGDVDWDALKNAVYLGVRALNHISELNETGIPQIDKNTKLERRIGLGTIGLAEMIIRAALRSGKDLRYSNDEGRAFAKKVLKFIKHSAYEASIELSKEIGPFPAYDFEQFKKSKFIQQLLKERPDLEEPLREHGIANVTILTQAPTGCQSPNTLVATDQGILTLEELVDSNGPRWQDHNLKVLQDEDSYLTSSKGFVNGYAQTKKITLESGLELEATPNHQYRVFSSTGEYLWKRADQLLPGDALASRIGGYNKTTEPELSTEIVSHFNHQNIVLPKKMCPDFAKFLGMYFADGSNHEKGIRIHLNAQEKSENDTVADFIESIFGIYPRRIVDRGCESLYINSTRLLRFLKINGLSKQKSHEVEIPKIVRQSSATSLQAFLDGYAYCDGSTSSYTYWIDTTSPKMSQQIAICMRLLGTNSVIQVFSNRESSKGNLPLYRIKKLNFGSVDFDERKIRYITKERRVWQNIAREHNKNLHFDTVRIVEDSINLTLDIEVPETETYVANSIVSHNTTGTITGYSSGCEPYFAMAYQRNSNVGTIMDGCPSFIDWLEEKEVDYSEYGFNLKELRKNKRVPKVFEEAQDICWKDHLAMQAIFAEQVDSSVSKCLSEGTLVNTNHGLIPIERCGDACGEDVFGNPVPGLMVIDENGKHQKVLSHYSAGEKEATRITLQNGASICGATASHKVKTVGGWKNLGELVPDDLVFVNDEFEVLDTGNALSIDINFARNTNANPVKLPEKMSVYLAKLLGMLVADGHLEESTGKVFLYEKSGLGDFYDSLAEDLFGVRPEVHEDPRTGVIEHRITSRLLVRYLRNLIGYRCDDKRVPEQILRGSFAEKQEFIEGLTLDGYLRPGRGLVVYEGRSELLAYQTAEMLRSFGVPRVYCGKKLVKSHDYYVYSVTVSEKLQEVIVPLELHKCSVPCYRERNQLVTFSPGDLETLPVTTSDEHYSSIRNLRQKERSCCTQNLANEVGLEPTGRVEKISTIEHLGKVPMYDIEVEDSHNYLVSGIVSHNTINLPNSASVNDIMEAYVGAYDMGIKSTAVYRDGSKTQILEHLKSVTAAKEYRPQKIVTMGAPGRPEELPCDIHTVSVKGEKWKVLVGLLHGRPYETFAFPEEQIELPPSKIEGTLIRNGGGKYKLSIPYGDDALLIKDVASFLLTDEHRMITRLLSTSLRHGAPLPALVSQLTKCDGEVTAFSKALMRVLRKYITDEEFIAASTCTQCQSLNLVLEEGCMKCGDCGFSACS